MANNNKQNQKKSSTPESKVERGNTENQRQLMKHLYLEAKKASRSRIEELVSVLFYIILADSISTTGARFTAPVYGLYLSERYCFKTTALILLAGYFLGNKMMKKRRNDDLRVYFTLGPILLMISPCLSYITFTYSDFFGPVLGPFVSLLPFYIALLNLSMSKLCHSKPFIAEIPLAAYCLLRSYTNTTSFLNKTFSACNMVSLLFGLWCTSEVYSSYLHYSKLTIKIPSYLKTSNKIKHAILIYFFIGAFFTHTMGPLQCNWFRGIKLPVYHKTPTSSYKILDWKDSNTGVIIVADYKKNDMDEMTLLRCDHSIIGITYKKDPAITPYFVFHYPEFTKYTPTENLKSTRNILQIGLGAGTSTRAFLSDSAVKLDVVELDKYVYDAARKYMGLPIIENLYIMDGGLYLQKYAKNEQYDVVVNDVFTGGFVDPNLASVEAFKEIKRVMRSGGIMVMNYFGNIHSKATKILHNTIKTVFQNTSVHLESNNESTLGEAYNIVIFASDNPLEFEINDKIMNEDMPASRRLALSYFLSSKTTIDNYCNEYNGK